ncbi:DNA topoisomerase I [Enterobacter hormaechei]|nr:DNA topoisomerase I [Enterobacter hormaechei]
MGKALVIVESPAKAKTINKYLGNDYVVKSSVGHIRDLPTSGSASKKSADSTSTKGAKKPKKDERSALVNRMGVNPWHNWDAHYEVLPGKEKVVNELKQLAEKADHIYLATDLDREGEAIAWHLREVIGGDDKRYSRVVFNEITKNAIRQAFEKPGELNIDRVKRSAGASLYGPRCWLHGLAVAVEKGRSRPVCGACAVCCCSSCC